MIDIKKIEKYNVADLLGKEIKCSCGRTHKIATEKIVCSAGGIKELVSILKFYKVKKLIIVTAADIYKKISKPIVKTIKKAGFKIAEHIFKGFFRPTIEKVEKLKDTAKECNADCILSIGSGCVTDCSKYISDRNEIPLVSVATAPSMDGYLSSNSVLFEDEIKTTIRTKTPNSIIFDSNIICTAPKRMIAASFGDVASKYLSVFDWQIANLFTGEYYCDTIARMSLGAAKLATKAGKQIINGEKEGYINIMEALIRSSVAMQLLKTTRCSSGGEHSTAHTIKMFNTANNKKSFMHGEEVILSYWNIVEVYNEYFTNGKVTIETNHEKLKASLISDLKLPLNKASQLIEKLKSLKLKVNIKQVLEKNRSKFAEKIKKIKKSITECRDIYYKLSQETNGMRESDLTKEEIYKCISLAPLIKDRFVSLSLMSKV